MRVTAKNIKTGETVKYINAWVKVETLENGFFKNGGNKITVTGTKLESVIRRDGRKIKIERAENFQFEVKPETFLTVKG